MNKRYIFVFECEVVSDNKDSVRGYSVGDCVRRVYCCTADLEEYAKAMFGRFLERDRLCRGSKVNAFMCTADSLFEFARDVKE